MTSQLERATSFFREEEHFATLAGHIRAAVQTGRRSIRLWSAACSTGEEPYSMAITALESLGGATDCRVQVLASDSDPGRLARAHEGIYPLGSIGALDQQRRRRYFLRGRGACHGLAQLRPEVRALVEFRHINLIEESWPVETRFDAIFCRKVATCFDRVMRHRVFVRLVTQLKEDGILIAGRSETLYWVSGLVASSGHSVYRVREGI